MLQNDVTHTDLSFPWYFYFLRLITRTTTYNDIIERNGVAGTLPFELSRLQSLRDLILEEGILSGTMPTELGEVRTLEYV